MFELEDYQSAEGKDPYIDWLNGLSDRMAKARIAVRVQRITAGNFGDCKPVQEGVWELRIDHEPGYRMYNARADKRLILLLMGGAKRKQQADTTAAVEFWQNWQLRKKPT